MLTFLIVVALLGGTIVVLALPAAVRQHLEDRRPILTITITVDVSRCLSGIERTTTALTAMGAATNTGSRAAKSLSAALAAEIEDAS